MINGFSPKKWLVPNIFLLLIATMWIVIFVSITPSIAEARPSRCAIVLPTGGREIIINRCKKCLVVNITRKRPGNAVPVTRSYNVQPNSKISLPFRGPGRSRITSVLPCKGEPGAAKNLMDPDLKENKKRPEEKTCVIIESSSNGDLQLLNKCDACKAALIERHYTSKTSGKRQAYKIFPISRAIIPSLGASKVTLLAEINCP
jgi:hypothetical protein